MFWIKNKKKKVYPCNPHFHIFILKVGFNGVFIARTSYPDEDQEGMILIGLRPEREYLSTFFDKNVNSGIEWNKR